MHVGAVNTWYHGVQRRTVVDPPGAAAVQLPVGNGSRFVAVLEIPVNEGNPLACGRRHALRERLRAHSQNP